MTLEQEIVKLEKENKLLKIQNYLLKVSNCLWSNELLKYPSFEANGVKTVKVKDLAARFWEIDKKDKALWVEIDKIEEQLNNGKSENEKKLG